MKSSGRASPGGIGGRASPGMNGSTMDGNKMMRSQSKEALKSKKQWI